ncbi:MAG: TraM recognition domain-containing protein [Chitinophaga rupis]
MNKTWIHQQGDFFIESPINFLAALIWFLRKYKEGIYCTLPNVIELAQIPYDKLFTVLNTEPEIQILVGPFIETFRNKSMKLLDSQIASARIPLGRLASPDLYYILTGNDCNLDINDPAAPKILCLGGDPLRQEALAPVLSLYIDRLNKRINQKDKYKCALICDEFATVRAYSMTTTIATARSNNIVPVIAVQDLSQLRTQYSRDEADLILNISGNLLCGQVGGETARWISERFPRVWQDRTSISINSSDTSIMKSHQWEPSLTPATIATLSSGEFVGIVADDPGKEMELKAFHARLVRDPKDMASSLPPLPIVREINEATIRENFARVRQDILTLVETEISYIYTYTNPK